MWTSTKVLMASSIHSSNIELKGGADQRKSLKGQKYRVLTEGSTTTLFVKINGGRIWRAKVEYKNSKYTDKRNSVSLMFSNLSHMCSTIVFKIQGIWYNYLVWRLPCPTSQTPKDILVELIDLKDEGITPILCQPMVIF